MKHLRHVISALWPAVGVIGIYAPVQAATNDAVAEVQQVVEAFQAAIIAKDAKTLSRLFLPDNNSWLSVASDELYRLRKAKRPDATKLNLWSYTEFADFIASSDQRIEEKFSNVMIKTDGAFASVHFDLVFLIDGKTNNRGQEAWHLAKTDDGWKISSMIYSANIVP